MVCALATHHIWTNGSRTHHRLRAHARCLHTYIPQVMWIDPSAGYLSASTPSHLLRTRRRHHDDHWSKRKSKSLEEATCSMMMIVFITFNSSCVPLFEGLWSSNPWEFELSGFRRNRTDDLGMEQCAKKSVRDDDVRPFSQLVVWKCLVDKVDIAN